MLKRLAVTDFDRQPCCDLCKTLQHGCKLCGTGAWNDLACWFQWCSAKPRRRFGYQWLDNVTINKYAKYDPNIPCGLRVMSIFTNWPRPARLMVSKASFTKRSRYACLWFDNISMNTYASFDQNIPCSYEHFNKLLTDGWTDRQTHIQMMVS